jgi:uncharacterized repeat protein (TIGR03803 family)
MSGASKYVTAVMGLLALTVAAVPQVTQPTFKRLAGLGGHPHAWGGLIQGFDGNLYSTTSGAGFHVGEVFRITPEGKLTAMHKLAGQSHAGLLLASDGNFYGMTMLGGPKRVGSVFRMTLRGKLTTLYRFCQESGCADGTEPNASLIQATDGNLYGTTTGGAANDHGTIFRMTLDGQLTTLHNFCSQSNCADGSGAVASLLEASDGNFYGTTAGGGTGLKPLGTIYRITPSGVFTVLYNFCSQPNCADGGQTEAGLMQATDGNLYGTAGNVVYRMALDGSYQVVYTFCSLPKCRDGSDATAPLIQATDGNLYGTTAGGGGPHKFGTAFRLTLGGQLTTLHVFCSQPNCHDGQEPLGPLFQATDGNLYGTTYGQLHGAPGTVYKLVTGFAPFVSPVPAYGSVGAQATILGMNLIGPTRVTFNGTPAASFTVNSAGSAITAIVPTDATTGTIQVTLPTGTLSSNVPFQVTP